MQKKCVKCEYISIRNIENNIKTLKTIISSKVATIIE